MESFYFEKALLTSCSRIAFPGASAVDQVKSDMYLPNLALNKDGSFVEIMHTDACRCHCKLYCRASHPASNHGLM